MRRLLQLAARLYPPSWRRRYAREFDALLQDINPGWPQVWDVFHGAVSMQIRSLGTIPVAATLAGVVIGGLVALSTPPVYASSATLRFNGPQSQILVNTERALGGFQGARMHASVVTNGDDAAGQMLRVTFENPDAAEAQRMATRLVEALAANASMEVLSAATLPTTPSGPDYPINLTAGGAAGLALGVLILLAIRLSRRPLDAR